MAKHKVEIEIEVPDGYEPTGECFKVGVASDSHLSLDGLSLTVGSRLLPLRKTWTPPDWLLNGWWVYRNGMQWYASTEEPVRCTYFATGFLAKSTTCPVVNLHQLSRMHREIFTPPPVDKIQIQRTT